MIKPFLKIIALILIVALCWDKLFEIGGTLASFSDSETSSQNSISAETLDFVLHSGQDNFVPESKALNMKPGDEVNRVIQVRNEGLLVFQYTAYTEKISGDDDFCNALQLKADLEGEEKYNGSLMGFNFSPIEISDSIDTWHFKASLPEGTNFQNKTCQIKFVFEGWQTNFSDPSSGFFDREEIESYFADQVDLASDSDNEESAEEPISEENPEQQNENVGQQEEQPATEEPSSLETPTGEELTEEIPEEEPIEENNSQEPGGTEESADEEITENNSNENSSGNNDSGGEEIPAEEPATTPDESLNELPINNSPDNSKGNSNPPSVDTITAPEDGVLDIYAWIL